LERLPARRQKKKEGWGGTSDLTDNRDRGTAVHKLTKKKRLQTVTERGTGKMTGGEGKGIQKENKGNARNGPRSTGKRHITSPETASRGRVVKYKEKKPVARVAPLGVTSAKEGGGRGGKKKRE